jgi:hypothetical protein
VGYEPGSKVYSAYDSRTWRVHVTHDSVFDELAQWNWGEEGGVHGEVGTELFEIKVVATTEYQLILDRVRWSKIWVAEQRRHLPANAPHRWRCRGLRSPIPVVVEHVSPPSIKPDLNYDHDKDAPLRFRRMDNVLGPSAVPSLAERVLQEELHAVSAVEPAMLEDAGCDPSWHAAMVDEL